jgi:hypothetical protein
MPMRWAISIRSNQRLPGKPVNAIPVEKGETCAVGLREQTFGV